jgi:hypothetical protein
MPQVKKAELIEGVVYMGSPVSVHHGKPDAHGVLHSRVFPGLRLPVAPLLAGDTAKVLAALTGPEPLSTKPPETSVKSDTCSLRTHPLQSLRVEVTSANIPLWQR